MLWVCIAVALVGAGVLTVGLRGRRVDEHPVCRTCGFDLHGLSGGACPECGGDATAPGAVRVGNRRRRRGAMVLGIVLLLVGLGGGGVMGWGAATRFDWNTVKPVWWLTREMRSADGAVMDAAAKELLARGTADRLGPGEWPEIVEIGLAAQGDAAGPWSVALGRLLESAHAAGALDEAGLERYARQGIGLSLDVRPKVKFGVPVPTRLMVRPRRISDAGRLNLRLSLVEIAIDGRVVERRTVRGGSIFGLSPSGWSSTGWPIDVDGLAPGTHELTQRWVFRVQQGTGHDAPPLAEWEEAFSARFELVPEGVATGALVDDPSLQQAMERAIKVRDMSLTYLAAGSAPHAGGVIDLSGIPMGVAFDVYWRIPDAAAAGGTREVRIGSIQLAGGNSTSYGIGEQFAGPPFEAETIDVVLRTNADVVEKSIDLTEVWNGALVYENVPLTIRRQGP